MSEYATLLLDAQGPIARITLNRPEKRNPIGPATCGELVHALARLREDAAVRVIILTGAGPVFSAGGDLSAMAAAAATRRSSRPRWSSCSPGCTTSASRSSRWSTGRRWRAAWA